MVEFFSCGGGIFFSEIEGWDFFGGGGIFFFFSVEGAIFFSEIERWNFLFRDFFLEIEDHKVNGSTPSLVLLFRPWIRCFNFF